MQKQRRNERGFSALIAIFALVVIGVIGIAGWYVWKHNSTDQPIRSGPNATSSKLVVPDYVSLYLEKSTVDSKQPALRLSVNAGGGCDEASDLKIKESRTDNELMVEIKGYDFTKTEVPADSSCPAVITESTATITIDLDWLKQSSEKSVVFKLAGKENKYRLTHQQNKITLTGIHASNVMSNELGYDPVNEPKTVEIAL